MRWSTHLRAHPEIVIEALQTWHSRQITEQEIRHLLARLLLWPPISTSCIIAWSLWRRRHQASAAIAHYKRQLNP